MREKRGIIIKVSPHLAEKIHKYCKEKKTSIAKLIRNAIDRLEESYERKVS